MESDKRVRGERRLYMFVDMRDESRTSTDKRGVFTGQRDNGGTSFIHVRGHEGQITYLHGKKERIRRRTGQLNQVLKNTNESFYRYDEICFGELCHNNVEKKAHGNSLGTSWYYGTVTQCS